MLGFRVPGLGAGERRPAVHAPPEPPAGLPPGRLVRLPGRGEVLVRDSGGDGPPVLLLHGWMFAADLNWHATYGPLRDAGYRVLALDHRGHGRGLRMPEPFRLADCAGDAAAVLQELDTGPALAVGYSLGGPVAALMARDHPESVAGMVLCATAQEWQDARTQLLWASLGAARLWLGLAPETFWALAVRQLRGADPGFAAWMGSELSRGSTRDLMEAGRELGRYDARPWIGDLDVPAAVVVTAQDTLVPPAKQRRLAEALGAPTFDVRGDHMAVVDQARRFTPALLRALAAVGREAPLAVAA